VPECEIADRGRGPSGEDRSQTWHNSPGEKSKRVAIARALIQRPHLLVCDEPTGNLDETTADSVASLLLDLHHKQNNILIVVTHSSRLADRFPLRFELSNTHLERRA
jgi:ABC-type lipoprotein export system ATPase subunit